MLQTLVGALSRPGVRLGNWRTQNGRIPNSRSVSHSSPLIKPTTQQRFISGNLFGSSSGGRRDGTNLFTTLKAELPKAPAKKPSKVSKSKKSSGKKAPRLSLKDIHPPTESLPGMEPVKDLGGLKKLIAEMPPEALDKLDPELKTLVENVSQGSLDSLNSKQLSKVLEKASKMSHLEISSRGRFQRSSEQSSEAWRSQSEVQEESELNKLAEETARFMLSMTEEDWKEAGIEKPDLSKPLSYDKLVELDKLLGRRGIKVSDFEKYLTPEELKMADEEELSGASQKSSKSDQKTSKSSKAEKLIHGYTQEELDNAPTLELPSLKRMISHNKAAWKKASEKYVKRETKKIQKELQLKPGDLSRALAGLVKHKQFDTAISTFKEAMLWESTIIGFEPIDLLSINTIISIYCFQNNLEMALETFDLIHKYQYEPDQMTFNSFLGLASSRRDDRIAIEWFNKMREADVKPDLTTYNTMISVFAQTGHPKEAEKWFDEMRVAIPNPDSTPYAHLIHMYGIVLDDFQEAMKWVKRMVDDKVPRNEFTAQVISDFHTHVQEQRKQKIKREQERPKTIQDQFIEAYRNGDSKLVEKIWDSMTYNRAHMTEAIWSTMLTYCSEHAKLELAVDIFEQMQEQGIPPSRVTCTVMHQIYRRLGNLELAQSMLERIDSAPPAQPILGPLETSAVPTASRPSISRSRPFS